MQRIITILVVLLSFNAHAQYYWQENFEAPYDNFRDRFVRDTAGNPNNLWHIGKPQKAVFDSAYSPDNVMVTDTVNPYPGHDTSVFNLLHTYSFGNSTFMMRFYYKLDKDAGTLAKLEISGDRGLNWIEPLTEDSTYMFYWGGPKPRFDTSVLNWTKFELYMDDWVHAYPGGPIAFPHYRTSDTILFRFTFASGNVVIPHDGWMLDNFAIEDYITEGYVTEVREDDMVKVYPNPSDGRIHIHRVGAADDKGEISVYELRGREVYHTICSSNNYDLDMHLPVGVYLLKYDTGKRYAVKQLVIGR